MDCSAEGRVGKQFLWDSLGLGRLGGDHANGDPPRRRCARASLRRGAARSSFAFSCDDPQRAGSAKHDGRNLDAGGTHGEPLTIEKLLSPVDLEVVGLPLDGDIGEGESSRRIGEGGMTAAGRGMDQRHGQPGDRLVHAVHHSPGYPLPTRSLACRRRGNRELNSQADPENEEACRKRPPVHQNAPGALRGGSGALVGAMLRGSTLGFGTGFSEKTMSSSSAVPARSSCVWSRLICRRGG